MRTLLIGLLCIASSPLAAHSQIVTTRSPITQLPSRIVLPPVTPLALSVLPSGRYVLTLNVPQSSATGRPLSRQLPVTLTHTGTAVTLNIDPSASFQGTMTGANVTLLGTSLHGSALSLTLAADADHAAGSFVISSGQTHQTAAGTATLARQLGNAVANMRDGGPDGSHSSCPNPLACLLRELWGGIIDLWS